MNDIEIKKKEVKKFLKHFHETIGQDESKKISELKSLLSKKISINLKNAIEAEIQSFNLEDIRLENERRELFCSTMKYIWTHPNKESLLIIKSKNSQNSYRNSDGRYEINTYYEFSEPLGELMYQVSDFSDTGEVYFIHEESRKINFSNKLTYEQFKNLFFENFVDTVDEFKECFKKIDTLKK